jgi:hypothetical protein
MLAGIGHRAVDTDRATVAIQLTDLEMAERVLTRVSKTPPARRPLWAAAAEAKPRRNLTRALSS